MSKGKIVIERDGNLLRIGNKWYCFTINEDGDFRTGTHTLEEVDIKKRDKQIATISEKLFKFVEPRLVLEDALKDMGETALEKVYNYVRKHKDVKPRVIKHCVAMKVGGVQIPIRG